MEIYWLTDGMGWKKMAGPLCIGVAGINYVIKLQLLRKGLLEKIIFTIAGLIFCHAGFSADSILDI